MSIGSSPESNDGSKLQLQNSKEALPDNVGSHLVIGILFTTFLATHPRRALTALRTYGIGGSYRKFYTNMRPYISYPISNPK